MQNKEDQNMEVTLKEVQDLAKERKQEVESQLEELEKKKDEIVLVVLYEAIRAITVHRRNVSIQATDTAWKVNDGFLDTCYSTTGIGEEDFERIVEQIPEIEMSKETEEVEGILKIRISFKLDA